MSFDTLAPYYRGMEFVMAGGMLQRCRTAHLAEVQNCQRALLLGEGPGLFLVELLRTNPNIEVTCVERSARMIAEAESGLKRAGLDARRVHFEQCDMLEWPAPAEEFDLVVTNFFLDCFCPEEFERVVAKIFRATKPRACWLLTDFRVPPDGWRRWRALILLRLMYVFFRYTTRLSATELVPPDAFLSAERFQLVRQRTENFGFVRADLWTRGHELSVTAQTPALHQAVS